MIVDRVDLDRSIVIGNVLAFERARRNQRSYDVAKLLNVRTDAFSETERNSLLFGISRAFIPAIAGYLGFNGENSLLDFADAVVGEQEILQEEFGERLLSVNTAATGPSRVARGFRVESASKYVDLQAVTPYRIITGIKGEGDKEIDYFHIYLVQTDVRKLEQDGKMPLVEDLLTLPFKSYLYYLRQGQRATA